MREFLTSALNPNSSTFIGVIGCGCSVATEPVADIISLYGLPLVSVHVVPGTFCCYVINWYQERTTRLHIVPMGVIGLHRV